MRDNKETLEDRSENEEITPVGDAFNPEINADFSNEEASKSLPESEKLSAELAEMRDKFLRLYSEFDNFRKRTQKERVELIKSANADLISTLLPVLDDFERARKYSDAENNSDHDKNGVELIYSKLKSLLESKGLKKMNSIGEVFSDDHHEAIANAPVEHENMKGKVVDEAECGYFLNDKVIRHAKVIVGS